MTDHRRKSQQGRKTTRFMSLEEARLWAEVRKTVRPLDDKDVFDEPASKGSARQATVPRQRGATATLQSARKRVGVNSFEPGRSSKVEQSPSSSLPPLANIDRRQHRRLASGRTQIEARLDLHGHRQHEAHEELKAFIIRCREQGLRHVLVITGKGQRARRDESNFYGSDHWSGVLRTQVPLWLSEPSMRPHIVGFEQAHNRHGGAGALYVRLRRRS